MVLKYRLDVETRVPASQVCAVARQRGIPCAGVEVDEENAGEQLLCFFLTEHQIPEEMGAFVGTAVSGTLVWHVYAAALPAVPVA